MSSPENWLDGNKVGRAKLGEQSQESKARRAKLGNPPGCSAWGWAHVGAEEGDTHHPLVENSPGRNFWASPGAEARGGAARDQGSPSRFLWLCPGRSFDLFLRKTAETQGTGSLGSGRAMGGQGGSGAGPGASSPQRQRRAGTRPPHPLPHPLPGEEQRRALSRPLGQPEPRCFNCLGLYFLF